MSHSFTSLSGRILLDRFEGFVDGRWYTFDATQPEPRRGRIAIAYGRDAADVALITELGPITSENMHVSVEKL